MNNLPAGLKPASLEPHKVGVSNQEKTTEIEPKFKVADNQTPAQPTQETAKTPPPKSKIFTKILAILLVFIFLVVGGALGYYYFAVYNQERFAGQLLVFFKDLEKEGQILNKTDVKDSDDYQGAIKILDERRDFLQITKDKLLEIRPPLLGPYRSLTSDISTFFDVQLEITDEAKTKAQFMIKLVELKQTLEPETAPFNQGTPGVKTVQDFFNERIPMVQNRGDELFKGPTPELSEISFEELKTSWTKTRPAFDKLLSHIRSFDPNDPLDLNKLNNPESPELKEAVDQVNSFGRLLDAAISSNSANDLLNYSFAEDMLKEKMGVERMQEVQRKMDELKEKYGKDKY